MQDNHDWEPPVRRERTGWRDLDLNDRHRLYGWNIPAVDIDFLEFDNGKPVALFEYKDVHAPMVSSQDKKLSALHRLADDAGIGFYFTRYTKPAWQYGVRAVNNIAWSQLHMFCDRDPRGLITRPYVKTQAALMEELAFVRFLYWLRHRDMPGDVVARIADARRAA